MDNEDEERMPYSTDDQVFDLYSLISQNNMCINEVNNALNALITQYAVSLDLALKSISSERGRMIQKSLLLCAQIN